MSYQTDIVDAVWANPTRTLDPGTPAPAGPMFTDQVGHAIWTHPTRTLSTKTWQLMVGKTSKVLTISNIRTIDHNRTFRCEATNPAGIATSESSKIILSFPELKGVRVSNSRIDTISRLGASSAILVTRSPFGGEVFRSDVPGVWERVGSPGAMVATAIADGGSDIVYILSADAGFYKSTNRGETWVNIGTLSTATPVGIWARSYALHVTATGKVLVADMSNTGGHIFRSTNLGESFTDLGAIATGGIYKFAERDGTIMCTDTNGRIYKSIDDGATWAVTASAIEVSPMWGLCAIGSDVWCCANANGKIYRSTDDGANWTLVHTVSGGADAMVATDKFVIMSTSDGDRALHVSLDRGETWLAQPSIQGDLDDILASGVAIGDHVIAPTNAGWVFYSDPTVSIGLPVGAWTPALTATQLWLDAADDTTTVSSVGGSVEVVSGNKVAQWSDKSGNNRHVTQATDANRPVKQGTGSKYGIVRFSGQVLSIGPSDIWRNTNKGLIYTVRRPSDWPMQPGYIIDIRNNAGSSVRALMSVDTVADTRSAGGRRSDADSYSAVTGTVPISQKTLSSEGVEFDYANTKLTHFTNAAVDGQNLAYLAAGSTDNTTSASVSIGAHKELFTPWRGDIAEVIIAHSIADREKIEGYLHHKWGIAYLLPALHPYKTTPPMA